MKSTERNDTSNQEMVTISRAEYNAQQGRIAKLEQQVAVLTEALRLSRHKQCFFREDVRGCHGPAQLPV